MRIATLLPSATEIVCALGLGDRLVGVSHSCNFPTAVGRLPKLTSTHVPTEADSRTIDDYVREHLTGHEALYDLDLDALADARPDVIISQALCDVCAVATGDVEDAVRSLPGSPLLVDLTPTSLADVFDDILRVGEALDAGGPAAAVTARLRERLNKVAERTAAIPQQDLPGVAFLEWLIPPFNGGHWNPELVQAAGGLDLLGTAGEASSTLDWQRIAAARPDVVFIACCGLSVERALGDVDALRDTEHWNALPAVQNDRVYVTDGSAYFASPGPRLLDGLEIMAHALHPDIHPRPATGECRTVRRAR